MIWVTVLALECMTHIRAIHHRKPDSLRQTEVFRGDLISGLRSTKLISGLRGLDFRG